MDQILGQLRSRQAGELQRWSNQPSSAHSAPAGPSGHLPGAEDAAKGSSSASRETIAIVALEGRACDPLARALDLAGYQMQVLAGLVEALAYLERARPVLVIVCGPAMSDTYQTLRRKASGLLLALLPESAETEMLSAFSAGVDDYQLTSISKGETVARVRAMLRRGSRAPDQAGRSEQKPPRH